MDQTLHDLGGIVLQGLPTFFLVLILVFFVKILYFNPLEKVLKERFRLTEGARRAAEESLKNANHRISEYEESLGRARAEIYDQNARNLQALQAELSAKVQAVRTETEQKVAEAKASIARQATEARANLEAQSELLAGQIADAILHGKAA
ncbi:MAG TPA: ATP synthase F0 subunit B [Bryobacteraceae bacterium]|nr:ATP synthase F0 subunit B [Bryobacteraceae bacterium]